MTGYILVREYANGKWQNKVYPKVYLLKAAAEVQCSVLNKNDVEDFMGEYWIVKEVCID